MNDPMAGLESRSFDFPARSSGTTATVLDALRARAVPYGPVANIPGGTSRRFILGAFARQIAADKPGTVKLYGSHMDLINGQQPIGRTSTLAEMQSTGCTARGRSTTPPAPTIRWSSSAAARSPGYRSGSRRYRVAPSRHPMAQLGAAPGPSRPRRAHPRARLRADAGVMAVRSSAGPAPRAAGSAQLQLRCQILDRLAVPL